MFDAYTVKKVFPRLAIAIVLIQLSWPIFTFMIFIVSQIAWGVEGLMYAPFGGREALDIGPLVGKAVGAENSGIGIGLSPELGIGALLGGAGVIGYGIALGAMGLLSLAVTVLIAVLIAFFILAIRQVVIVVLLVLSPIALVAWILPNTEKIWKLWWESFSKLLFMYPLILLLIAGGKVAAFIAAEVSEQSSTNDGFGMAIVIVAWFAPYFLIPSTFKLAGSTLANIAGVANDRSRGVFDRLKKGRQERMAERHKRADESRLFNPNGRLAGLNTAASAVADPSSFAKILAGGRGREEVLSGIGRSRMEGTKKLAGALSEQGFNDRSLGALTYWDGTEDGLERLASDLDAQYQASYNPETGAYDENYRIGAEQLRQNAGMLYGAWKSDEFGRGDMRAAAGLASAAQGFTSGDEISRVANDLDARYQGMGMGNAYKTQAELAGARAGALTKPGYTNFVDENGEWAAGDYSDESSPAFKQIGKIGVGDIGQSKGLFGRKYVDHSAEGGAREVNTEERSVGKGMVKRLRAGDQELMGTLQTAYQSYNNATIRKDIKRVFTEAGLDPSIYLDGRRVNPNEAENQPGGSQIPGQGDLFGGDDNQTPGAI